MQQISKKRKSMLEETFIPAVMSEVSWSLGKKGKFNSEQEFLGTILMELDEFRLALQSRNQSNATEEAVQLASLFMIFLTQYGVPEGIKDRTEDLKQMENESLD